MKKILIKLFAAVFTALVIWGSYADVTYAKTNYKTCIKSGCNKSRASGSSYCYKHKSGTKTNKSNSLSSSKKTTTSKKKTYSKKHCDMPDPDDYEDFDDFMDDWDGCMPDGSDAEDYYEDW